MIVTVKFLIDGSVFDSKIGAQIDNARAGRQKWFGKFGREAVRQRQKNKAGFACELFWIWIRKFKFSRGFVMRKTRENLGERFAGQLPRSCRHKIDMGMRQEQTHQFLAGVTGSANYRELCVRHNAQCVFRLGRIATKSVTESRTRLTGLGGN